MEAMQKKSKELFPFEVDTKHSTKPPCVTIISGDYWGDEETSRVVKYETKDNEIFVDIPDRRSPDIYYKNQKFPIIFEALYISASKFVFVGTLQDYSALSAFKLKHISVIKSYSTRYDNSLFPTELNSDETSVLQGLANEYNTITGRPIRCGWLDLVPLVRRIRDQGYTELCLNGLDIIGNFGKMLGSIKICTQYELVSDKLVPIYKTFEGGWEIPEDCECFEDLPKKAQDFVNFIEGYTGIPVSYIGIGPRNEDTIVR